MSDVTELAQKVSGETPWWATAPVWLAAGIVGVPSAIALAAGWFIAQNVAHDLKVLTQYNLSELTSLSQVDTDQKQRWESVRRLLLLQVETDIKICVHEAQTKEQVNECISTGEAVAAPLRKK